MKIKVELPKDSPQVKLEFQVPEILIEAIKQKLPVKLTLETEDKKQEQ
jgi:hypothetical protein